MKNLEMKIDLCELCACVAGDIVSELENSDMLINNGELVLIAGKNVKSFSALTLECFREKDWANGTCFMKAMLSNVTLLDAIMTPEENEEGIMAQVFPMMIDMITEELVVKPEKTSVPSPTFPSTIKIMTTFDDYMQDEFLKAIGKKSEDYKNKMIKDFIVKTNMSKEEWDASKEDILGAIQFLSKKENKKDK